MTSLTGPFLVGISSVFVILLGSLKDFFSLVGAGSRVLETFLFKMELIFEHNCGSDSELQKMIITFI